MADHIEEKVIMTPKCKTATSTTLVVERKAVEAEASDKIHVAGGDHTGIIINKEQVYENGVTEPCHAQLEFRVYLVSGATGSHTREARALRFWFKPQATPNYVGFIKKIIKLMQHKYLQLKILEIELRQEGSGTPPPVFIEDNVANQTPVISEQRVLDMIENAYPNPLTVDDFITSGKWSKAEVKDALEALEEKGGETNAYAVFVAATQYSGHNGSVLRETSR
ncbi:hypothetical protein MSG28_002943 [Choristoneura fumiferana]|uniref:Uncharacterized protein n=1 Tax=Choristoneura fumiferana TaxID=7141 RepID=A0ACC0JK10_CHOFU|nr:hypothetical protein MSG28_002943 [Choristoneura fumiferana]